MQFKEIAEIGPWHAANPDCPFNCVGCEYLSGISMHGNHEVEIECDLDDND